MNAPSLRSVTAVGAAVVIAVTTIAAILQELRPDPLQPPRGADRFWKPMETNAFRRLPTVRSELQSVATLSSGRLVWAVGTGGVIMSSSDGGQEWTRGEMARPPGDSASTSKNDRRMPSDIVSVHFISADIGLVGSATGKIMRSTDGGRHWSDTPGGWGRVYEITSRPGGEVLAATDSGIIESIDRGQRWRAESRREAFTSIAAAHSTRIATTGDGRVFVQSDGAEWSEVTAALVTAAGGGARPAAATAVESTLYAAMQDTSTGGPARLYILRSDDGGTRWSPSGYAGEWGAIRSLRFTSREVGWLVTRDGMLLHTTDGGVQWHRRRSDVRDAAFDHSGRGYASNFGNNVLATTDAGRTWRIVAGAPAFRAVRFFGERRGIAVGDAGTVASTRDGGRTWSMRARPTQANLRVLAAVGQGRVWTAGDDGTIRQSTDNGRTWTDLYTTGSPIRGLAVASRGKAGPVPVYAVTTSGEVHAKLPSAAWRQIATLPDSAMGTLRVTGSGTCFVLGAKGLWKGTDLCRSWSRIITGQFAAADFADDAAAWAARDSIIFRTTDGGITWDSARLGDGYVTALRFANRKRGWAAGRNSRIWSSEDGGLSWQRLPIIGVDDSVRVWPDLHALAATGDTLARAVGDGGTVLEGNHSQWAVIVNPPGRNPAPWYWVTLMISIVALFLARPRTATEEVHGPKDIFASDRPLRPGDPDLLGFKRVAKGLSRFIRNSGTEPPLTLAITGEWGRGKSSLMNLVREDLRKRGRRTVWFNAWDHANEQHLLGSLLATVQKQAVPDIMTPIPALRFRLRLIVHRLFRRPSTSARVGLIAFLVLATLVAVSPGATIRVLKAATDIFDGLGSRERLAGWWGEFVASVHAGRVETLLLFSSGVTFVVAMARTLRAFGLKASTLLAPVARAARLRDLEENASFRYRFAQDFQSVTSALGGSRLVVFIDDLDRCPSEAVVRVLETVNFLSQSGNSIVVLGFDERIVRRDVYRHFLKIAKEARDLNESCGDPRPAPEEAKEHADAFFEKLVNIAVRLPAPDPDRVAKMIEDPEGPDPDAVVVAAARMRQKVLRVARVALVSLLAVWGTGYALAVRGSRDSAARRGGGLEASLPPRVQDPRGSASMVPRRDTTYREIDTRFAAVRPRPGTVFPGESPRGWGGWLVLPVFLVPIFAFIVYRVLRPDARITDSKEFKDSLQAWAPLLKSRLSTPRAAKRFLNRLRYYAMMVGGEPPLVGRRKAINEFLRRPRVEQLRRRLGYFPVRARHTERYPDELLVALSALAVLDPEALRPENEEPLICDLDGFLKNRFGADAGRTVPHEAPATRARQLADFRELSGTVRTN
jgi:photosystem II stability/assembly factor-like uncharacterized protein